MYKRASSGVTTGKNPSELNPATDETMKLALDVQSAFLGMSLSNTDIFLPHIVLEPRRAEATTAASYLEAQLQAAMVEQLPENHKNIEYSACQQIGTQDTVSDALRPNADVEMDSIHKLADRKRDILWQRRLLWTLKELLCVKYSSSVHRILYEKELIRNVLTM
jgi:hypothetical protein